MDFYFVSGEDWLRLQRNNSTLGPAEREKDAEVSFD